MTLQELIEKHGINLHEEGVIIAGKDGILSVTQESRDLNIEVILTDRVIVESELSILEVLE